MAPRSHNIRVQGCQASNAENQVSNSSSSSFEFVEFKFRIRRVQVSNSSNSSFEFVDVKFRIRNMKLRTEVKFPTRTQVSNSTFPQNDESPLEAQYCFLLRGPFGNFYGHLTLSPCPSLNLSLRPSPFHFTTVYRVYRVYRSYTHRYEGLMHFLVSVYACCYHCVFWFNAASPTRGS